MKLLANNPKARFDYKIEKTLIAGVVLGGSEVKSAKQGAISLKGSFVTINRGELYLINAHINHYKYSASAHDETRTRKLLIHKKELDELIRAKQNGMAIVPTRAGIERGLIKIEIGVGRGLKKFDKRAVLKQRDAERKIRRATKH